MSHSIAQEMFKPILFGFNDAWRASGKDCSGPQWRAALESFLIHTPEAAHYTETRATMYLDGSLFPFRTNKKTGYDFSILGVSGCHQTAQCETIRTDDGRKVSGGCYASLSSAREIYLDGLLSMIAKWRASVRNPELMGYRIAEALRTIKARRKLFTLARPGGLSSEAYVLRINGTGDLIPILNRVIRAALRETRGFQDTYGLPVIFAIYTRKPEMIRALLRDLDAADAARLAINFSVDGADVAETEARLDRLRNWKLLPITDRIASVTFPDHAEAKRIAARRTDCPVIRHHTRTCQDCGICFNPTPGAVRIVQYVTPGAVIYDSAAPPEMRETEARTDTRRSIDPEYTRGELEIIQAARRRNARNFPGLSKIETEAI